MPQRYLNPILLDCLNKAHAEPDDTKEQKWLGAIRKIDRKNVEGKW